MRIISVSRVTYAFLHNRKVNYTGMSSENINKFETTECLALLNIVWLNALCHFEKMSQSRPTVKVIIIFFYSYITALQLCTQIILNYIFYLIQLEIL